MRATDKVAAQGVRKAQPYLARVCIWSRDSCRAWESYANVGGLFPILMQCLRAAGLARPAAEDLPGYHDLLSGLAIWAAAARGNRIQVSSPQLVQRPSLRKTRVNA